jgi:hypothetical protein
MSESVFSGGQNRSEVPTPGGRPKWPSLLESLGPKPVVPSNDFFANWESVKPATADGPIPLGKYVARWTDGVFFNAGSGTPGYKSTFEIVEGPFAGRRVWHDIWLTEAARSIAKRDFDTLQVPDPKMLQSTGIPRGLIFQLSVVVRSTDDGTEFNVVRSFRFMRREEAKVDPFAPSNFPQPGGHDHE